MFFSVLDAQKSPKQRQIGRLVLLPLEMEIITSFWVYIKDIVLYYAIMRKFFNHSWSSSVCDSSCPAELNQAPL